MYQRVWTIINQFNQVKFCQKKKEVDFTFLLIILAIKCKQQFNWPTGKKI